MNIERQEAVDRVDALYQTYRRELDKLVEINKKCDFSSAGDAEFQRQSRHCDLLKTALISAQNSPVLWPATGQKEGQSW